MSSSKKKVHFVLRWRLWILLTIQATDVEGIFRLSGSAKRIKDLQTIFNSPERYGKGLDWTGYTVHDAANILRRYLNQLPEPIVPLQYYEQFRDPLRAYQAKVGSATHAQAMENQEHSHAVVAYQKLITQLPALNRQLLLYILDLLAVFASKSDLNRMTAQNLAAIFQPGIISHPNHDMAPNEYRLSQDVLIFLIENQDNFLIGMTGTAMDEKTKDEVKSGPPSIKTQTPKPAIGRSASTASAGADSIRRTAGPRRNGSMSSRHSRERGSPGVSSPATPASPSGLAGTTGSAGSGLGRSNTLPSNRSPPLAGPRFQRMSEANSNNTPIANAFVSSGGPGAGLEEEDEDSTPFPMMSSQDADFAKPPTQIGGGPGRPDSPTREHPHQDTIHDSSAPAQETSAGLPIRQSANEYASSTNVPAPLITQDLKQTQETSSGTPVSGKPQSRDRKISNLLSISPIFGPSDPNQRQPRKLQKRRIPGSHNESAQSSQASLNAEEGTFFHTPTPAHNTVGPDRFNGGEIQSYQTSDAMVTPTTELPQASMYATSPTSQENRVPSRSLMPPHSPTASLRSRGSATDPSDLDALEDPAVREEKKRSKFRLSTSRYEPPLAPPPTIGQLPGARTSNSSLGSNRPRKSFTGDSQQTQVSVGDTSSTGQPSFMHFSSRESADMLKDNQTEPEKKGLFGRFKAKISQSRDQHEGDRAKSPPRIQGEHAGSRSSLSAFTHDHFAARGRSFDRPREDSLSYVQERDQPPYAQPPLQTFVQPPTPVPGSTPAPEHARPVPSNQATTLPPLPPLQSQPTQSTTFPSSGTSIAPIPAAAPAPMPIAQSGAVPQEAVSGNEMNVGPSSPTRGSHNGPQGSNAAPVEQSIYQDATNRSLLSEAKEPVVPSEQTNETIPSAASVLKTDPTTRNEHQGQTGQSEHPTQPVHTGPHV